MAAFSVMKADRVVGCQLGFKSEFVSEKEGEAPVSLLESRWSIDAFLRADHEGGKVPAQ